MRFLLASTGLGALASVLSSPASADTTISTATTAALNTAAAGDITVTTAGSIKPAAGAVITIDSNNKVNNQGTLAIQGVNGAAGIVANTGLTGDITHSGTITIDENFTPTDTDNDGDLDGPFAQGSNRFGVHVLSGGTYTGNIIDSGTITIEGNNSAGLAIDSSLTGSLNATNGKISVLGDNSVGIRTGAVSGNVNIGSGSTVTVQGANDVGVLLGGNIGGAVVLQGTVNATGYRYPNPPSDTSKLDADDLLQGGPAVLIAGNVGGGILLDTHPADNDPNNADEDGDGIPDANETTATITSLGAAPALKIGSATQDITVGAVASSAAGHGLVIKGTVTGSGVYAGVTGTALDIGGVGHSVSIAGGMTVSGTISASANGASATGIHIGTGASVPQIVNSGTISASGGSSATAVAQAIQIDAGATVNSITNSGSIQATRTGTAGTAAAIVDKSGTLSLVQNSGSIGVGSAATLGDSATAIDLSARTTGAVVRQVAAATGKPAPTINGRILFGSGNDVLDIQAGTINGKVDFGGGADAMTLSGTSAFHGTILNSGGLALNVGAGSIADIQNVGTVNLASLTTGTGASLGFKVTNAGHTIYQVAGTADFAAGTKLVVTFDTIGAAAGNYTIINAGTLVGAQNLTSTAINVPFLFTSSLTSTANQVVLGVVRKTSAQLGLNQSEAAAIDAVLTAADTDTGVRGVLLGISDGATLQGTLQQMLPEHAGGAFETATKPSRLAADILAQPGMINGLWMQQLAWTSSKSIGSTSRYQLSSWGAVSGYDVSVGPIGNVGVSLGYYYGKDSHSGAEIASDHYEAGAYWRGGTGPLRAWARGTVATIDYDSTRRLSGVASGQPVSRESDAKWNGRLYSASGGVSYEAHFGRLSIRPNASVEYYKLHENAYTETGGGTAYDLTVRSRNSNEAAANAMVTLGYDFTAREDPDSGWFRVELDGGRREIFSSTIANTIASFGTGAPFTLSAEERKSGWRGGLRVAGGGGSVSFVAEANAEQQQGHTSFGGRMGVSIGL
jgi:hypothetical protein